MTTYTSSSESLSSFLALLEDSIVVRCTDHQLEECWIIPCSSSIFKEGNDLKDFHFFGDLLAFCIVYSILVDHVTRHVLSDLVESLMISGHPHLSEHIFCKENLDSVSTRA